MNTSRLDPRVSSRLGSSWTHGEGLLKRLIVFFTVTGMTLIGSVVVAGPAPAKVAGSNGQIVFVRTNFSTDNQTIYFVNPDGSHLRRLVVPWDVEAPHWSPNGDLIAFNACCRGHTVILNPDTGDYRILPEPSPSLFTFCTVWSPNAKRFACFGEGANPRVTGLYTIRSSDGGGLTRLTNSELGVIDFPIDYSSDGTRIVFGRVSEEDHSCTKRSALFVVNIDGSRLHRITPWRFCDDDGSWSPDGRWIAFERRGAIFTVRPDGSGLRKVPLRTNSQSFAGDISWSPNGKKMAFILFAQTSDGTCCKEGIGTANANGTDVRFVTTAPGGLFDHEADWGPHPLWT